MTSVAPASTPTPTPTPTPDLTTGDFLRGLPRLLHTVTDPAQLREWDRFFTKDVAIYLTRLDILYGHRSFDITDAVKEHLFFERGVFFKGKNRPATARLLLQLVHRNFQASPAADDEYDYLAELLALARRYVTELPELQCFIDLADPLFRRGEELRTWSFEQWSQYYAKVAALERRRAAARAATPNYGLVCAEIDQDEAALHASMRSISRDDLRGVEVDELEAVFLDIVYGE